MSTTASPNVDLRALEETRRHIQRLIDEVGRLSEAELSPPEYYGEVLKRVLGAMAAPAGAVYVRTPQGNLQLSHQNNLREVGLDEEGRKVHDELLRQAMQNPQPIHLEPHSGGGPAEDGHVAPGNPTNFILLLVPILLNNELQGFLEVFQSRDRPRNAIQGFLQFMGTITDLMARFQRNQLMGQMAGQQQVWTQLELFARQVHASLSITEVAYLVANEGRRLIDCDRLSVAVRQGRKARVEAVSGSDVVEKRSNLVKLMRKLFDAVLRWGEKLVYTGTKDESLPPDVIKALDAYLAESNSKILVLLPLKDEREKESKKPPRSALLMECFETTTESPQLVSRLEVVGRHSVSALYNAAEYRRIPFRWVWLPMAKVQDGLGGKAKAITLCILAALVAVVCLMCLVYYPLKMDGKGKLLPITNRWVYAPEAGTVEFVADLKQHDVFPEESDLIELFSRELKKEADQLQADIATANQSVDQWSKVVSGGRATPEQKVKYIEALGQQAKKKAEYDTLMAGLNPRPEKPGQFVCRAPTFSHEERRRRELYLRERNRDGGHRGQWTLLSDPSVRESLIGQRVDPTKPLFHIGDKESGFEVELKIPQKNIYQIQAAFERLDTDRLDVDLKVRTAPTQTYRGILFKNRLGGKATPQKDDNNEPDPVVTAYVTIDHPDIPEDERIPLELRTTSIEVLAKVRCGKERLGYVLFYGVWEFLCEKVLFAF